MSFKVTCTLVFAAIALTCLCAATEEYQQLSQDQHNTLRKKHTSRNIKLDDTLNEQAEACAQDYAERNEIDHKCAKELGKGENLYISWTSGDAPDPKDAMADAIQGWYDENKGYNYNDPGKSKGTTGHFTQVVWDASLKLGCGVKTVEDRTVACCLYDPAGNVRGGRGGYEYYKKNVKKPTK